MKLYGKISANGVDVSTNCDELVGTGTKEPVGKIIRVSHLQPNNNYCFAVAPLNTVTSELMDIGKTSLDIPTFNPLPVCNIAGSLAKVAYQIGEYDIAYEAAKLIAGEFTETAGILDPKTNSYNKTLKLRLKQSKI
jgi:hypothetical protein